MPRFSQTEVLVFGAAGQYVFSCVVQALPPPTDKSNAFYRFVFAFAHALGANWSQFKGALGATGGTPTNPTTGVVK